MSDPGPAGPAESMDSPRGQARPEASGPRVPLDAARLAELAGVAGFGLTVVEEIDSTNAALARVARADTSEPVLLAIARQWRARANGAAASPRGHVLVAERQTAGRGRLDRSWVSRPGAGLTVSVLVGLSVARARLGWLPLVAGTALASTIRSVGGLPVSLKWPNDLLVGGEKLAGILVELVPTPPAEPSVVIGFGLNVHAERDELPERSTSLLLSGARPAALDRTALLGAILAALATSLAGWAAHPASARENYLEVCGTIGRQVRVELPDGTVEQGTATDVDPDGQLIVDGRAYSAGDIVHLR